MKYALCALLALHSVESLAQDTTNKNLNSRIGLIAGPFLPSKISGVTEIIQVAGLRLGTNTKLGNFEAEGWLGNGSGVSYQSFLVNYRVDIPSEMIPVHCLIGIHADAYRKADATPVSSGGWQVGGGVETKIVGPLMLRTDFESRFGPGASLLILVSLMLGF